MIDYISAPSKTKAILTEYGLKANKNFGQNFLVDPATVNKVGERILPEDYVIEIGPGLGSLTQILCEKAEKVMAYEIDENLIDVLQNNLKDYTNFTLTNMDFLNVNLDEVIDDAHSWVIVSNLPYYITSQLLMKIFGCHKKIRSVIVMMQKEVAQRFTLKDNIKDLNALNIISQYRSEVRLVCKVPKTLFMPAPNVDSAILEYMFKQDEVMDDLDDFIEFLNQCFKQRRKMLSANLKDQDLSKVSIDLRRRAEQLSVDEFIQLYQEIRK